VELWLQNSKPETPGTASDTEIFYEYLEEKRRQTFVE
jgi:hypothetical protein